MSLQVPRLDSLRNPPKQPNVGDYDNLKIKLYGIGVDCHSRFFQICLRISMSECENIEEEDDFKIFEIRSSSEIPGLQEAKETLISKIMEYYPDFSAEDFHYTCESSGPYHKPLLNAWKGAMWRFFVLWNG